MTNPIRVFRTWLKSRDFWEDICTHCGRCCFERTIGEDGLLEVDYAQPCEFFDKETHLCTVYECRFETCNRCRKMSVYQAAYGRYVPNECAYARLFREDQSL